jgi:hypothetical protein
LHFSKLYANFYEFRKFARISGIFNSKRIFFKKEKHLNSVGPNPAQGLAQPAQPNGENGRSAHAHGTAGAHPWRGRC